MIYLPSYGMSDDVRESLYVQTRGFVPYKYLMAARNNWRGVQWLR